MDKKFTLASSIKKNATSYAHGCTQGVSKWGGGWGFKLPSYVEISIIIKYNVFSIFLTAPSSLLLVTIQIVEGFFSKTAYFRKFDFSGDPFFYWNVVLTVRVTCNMFLYVKAITKNIGKVKCNEISFLITFFKTFIHLFGATCKTSYFGNRLLWKEKKIGNSPFRTKQLNFMQTRWLLLFNVLQAHNTINRIHI